RRSGSTLRPEPSISGNRSWLVRTRERAPARSLQRTPLRVHVAAWRPGEDPDLVDRRLRPALQETRAGTVPDPEDPRGAVRGGARRDPARDAARRDRHQAGA